jgi:hypothetical protein
VKSSNTCGDGAFSAVWSFTTEDIPPILLVDDDDDGPDVQPVWTAALDALGLSYDVWVTGSGDVEPGASDIAAYDVVLWMSGDRFGTQNSGPAGPSPSTEAALGTWLDGGGCFFISSQDYVWDKGVTAFMTSRLGVSTVTNDNGDYTSVTGQNVFAGLGPYALTFPYTDFSDPITVGNGGVQAMLGNNANVAGTSKDGGTYKTSYWAFGLEALPIAGQQDTLQTFIDWCGLAVEIPDIDVSPGSLSSTQSANSIVNQTLTIANTGTGTLNWSIDEDNSPTAAPVFVHPFLDENAGVREGADWSAAGTGTGVSVTAESTLNPASQTITQSVDPSTITSLNSVSCNAGGIHTDNSYLRAFDLDSFGLTSGFNVTEVEIGIETAASGSGTGQPMTVNLYQWDGVSAFTFANLIPGLVGTATVNVPDQALSLFTIPVAGSVAGGQYLVVEIFTPDGTAGNNSLFIGSNAAGQTGPSYLAAVDCGVAEPTNTAAIGFPGMHIVMSVTGDAAGDVSCDAPEDIPWLSVSPTSGSTGASGSTDVTVTYDSTGLTPGDYTAALCVSSNDPDESLVVVNVDLTVQTGYTIYLPIAVREP